MSIQPITVQQFFSNSYVYTTSLPTSSIVAANANPLSMSDVRRVFDGKRVVFTGDSAVRSIYRDVATFLVTGHRLCSSQVTLQHGEKLTPDINERRVRGGGRRGMSDYIDERLCYWSSSSSLHYIYLPSLNCQESTELLRLVRNADMLIFSSMRGDMDRKMTAKSPIPFSDQLDAYTSKVFSLCRSLVEATTSSSSDGFSPLLLWLTPLPLDNALLQEQKDQFLQIVAAGENSAKRAGFRIFDQLNVSLADGGKFANNRHGHFSSIGIRLISTLLAEIAANHWQRPLRLPMYWSPLSPVPLIVDTSSTDISSIVDDRYPQ